MRKIALLCGLCLAYTFAFAQNTEETKSNKSISLGIQLGVDYNYLKLENSDWDQLGIADDIQSLNAQSKVGFNIGLLANFKLSNLFSIVPQALISFQETALNYKFTNQPDYDDAVEPVAIVLPLHFVFTNPQETKFRPSVFAGPRYSYGISKTNENSLLTINHNSFSFDLGTGLEINMNRVRLKPELLYSFGLSKLNTDDTDIYHQSINHLSQDKISFRILFY